MEYQGFTGSNYDEDDIERAKRGGVIGGFGRNAPIRNEEKIMDQSVKSPLEITENTNPDEIEHKRLDDIKDRITMRQRVLDSLIGSQTTPEKMKELQDQQALDEDMYNLDPLHDEHEKRRLQENAKMPDMPPFRKLNNLIR